ncbi:MAG: hypothetical protein ACLFV7_06825 [Phycisphaerae bacterium]
MGHWRIQRKELTQVQVVTAAALAGTYFLLWPLLRPADPQGPLAFLAGGNAPGIALVLVVMALLAAAAAAVTTHSRPVGAMVTALLGTGGLSLHSPSLHALLWDRDGRFGGMFTGFIIELLLLAIGVLVVDVVVSVVRSALAKVNPAWVWKDPLQAAPPAENQRGERGWLGSSDGAILALVRELTHRSSDRRDTRRRRLQSAGLCAVLTVAVSVALLMLLMQSDARGQVLFALLGSFTLGAAIAHQAYPTRLVGAILPLPVLVGIAFYLLGMFASGGPHGAHNAWLRVPNYAYALPLDWITAGVGGAGLGFWISSRIHELRHMEKREQGQDEQTA